MSLTHTRDDPFEAMECLVTPRNPERRRRMANSFQRRERIEAKPPNLEKKTRPSIIVTDREKRIWRMWCLKNKFDHEPVFYPWKRVEFSTGEVSATYGFDNNRKIKAETKTTLAQIIIEVAIKYGVTVNDIKSHRRARKFTLPRKEFFYRARQETGHSYPAMARFCGDRDHTTALYNANDFAQMLKDGLVT